MMRTWFITGTSRGFGQLIASSALASGDAVVATTRNPESIPEFLRRHANLLALRLDVTNEGEAREAVRAEVERFGHIDVLAARIDDYAETVGKVRTFAVGADGQQPGDPKRLADAMIALVNAKNPPLRLPLGADTVQRIEQKHHEVEAELSQWRGLALSTGFVDASA